MELYLYYNFYQFLDSRGDKTDSDDIPIKLRSYEYVIYY